MPEVWAPIEYSPLHPLVCDDPECSIPLGTGTRYTHRRHNNKVFCSPSHCTGFYPPMCAPPGFNRPPLNPHQFNGA